MVFDGGEVVVVVVEGVVVVGPLDAPPPLAGAGAAATGAAGFQRCAKFFNQALAIADVGAEFSYARK